MSRQRAARRRSGRPSWQRISSGGWFLISLLVGLLIGLYYAWIIAPVIYVNSSPSRLSQPYKAEYIFLVSQSYAADGNWPQAQERLAALEDSELSQTVNTLLETYVRDLQSPDALRHMAALAQQLGAQGGAVAVFAPTPDALPTPTLVSDAAASQRPSPTAPPPTSEAPSPTPTASATVPPTPSVALAYQLLGQERACNGDDSPLIEVVVQEMDGAELPGVEVEVQWEGGSDRFYTGFKPDLGAGYGDFAMSPGVSYTVILVEGSPEVSGLRVEPCDDGRDGGWRLLFEYTGADGRPAREP